MIKSFGQKVNLEVFGKDGELVFSSQKVKETTDPYTSLRVDFHVIEMQGYNRAKFEIYNLNNRTVKELTNGERYCKLSVSLHDQPYEVLIDEMFVSNAMRETRMPSNVTSLFCYDKIRKDVTEETVSFSTFNTSLKGIMTAAIAKAGFKTELDFKDFPNAKLDYRYPAPIYMWSGTIDKLFNSLGKQFDFKWFIKGKGITAMYIPSLNNLEESSLSSKKPDIILRTSNMRATPKIGPATLQVTSNLDTRIRPTSILDSSKLVTASATDTDETLQTSLDFLKTVVSGFSKFQCIAVEHQGSNFTKKWETSTTAIAPRGGNKMPLYNWHGLGG
jgi:hypothetical protein